MNIKMFNKSKIFSLVMVIVMLVALLPIMQAPQNAAHADDWGDPVSCSTATVDYEKVLSWVFGYLNIEVVTAQPVVQYFNFKTWSYEDGLVGERVVVDFDIDLVLASGEHVVHSGSFELGSNCTPDFPTTGYNWDCRATYAYHDFDYVLADGTIIVIELTYDELYDWALNVGLARAGVHYEFWQLQIWYLQWEFSIRGTVNIETSTCWPIWHPGLREVFPLVATNDNFIGEAYSIYREAPDGSRTWFDDGVVSPYGDISLVLGPSSYVSDPAYGTYETLGGTVGVHTIYVAVINGVDVQRVIITTNNGEAQSFLISGDTVNQQPRTPHTLEEVSAWR